MSVSRSIARQFLTGVGDAALGEWVEEGNHGVVHVRRRLSTAEQAEFNILEVRDIRGSDEEGQRLVALFADNPHLVSYIRAGL